MKNLEERKTDEKVARAGSITLAQIKTFTRYRREEEYYNALFTSWMFLCVLLFGLIQHEIEKYEDLLHSNIAKAKPEVVLNNSSRREQFSVHGNLYIQKRVRFSLWLKRNVDNNIDVADSVYWLDMCFRSIRSSLWLVLGCCHLHREFLSMSSLAKGSYTEFK